MEWLSVLFRGRIEHHTTNRKRRNFHCSEYSWTLREVILFGEVRLFRADNMDPLPSGYFSG
jgi:hypothetical protein